MSDDTYTFSEKFVTGLVVALVLFILFMGFCFRTIGVGKVGVITSFGRVNSIVQSGVVIKAPWPFQSLSTFDIRTQKDQADATAASQDLQDVKATVVTNYHIDNEKVGDLYRTVGTDYKKRLIDPAIQESLKATTAKYAVADLIVHRSDVKDVALASLKSRLAPRGIVIEDLSLTNIEFSDTFTKAIEAKQVAEQQAQQAKFGAEKAKNEADAEIARATGDAEAQRLRQSSLTPELLQQQAIARWNGVLPTYAAGDAGNFFNIPTR